MKKKSGAFLGFTLGLCSIFGAFVIEGGTIKALFLLPPLIVVFGGTFAAVIIGSGIDHFKKIFPLIKLAYLPPRYNLPELINNFVELSKKERKEGFLAIKKELHRLKYQFPKKLIRYAFNETNEENLQKTGLLKIKTMQDR